MRGPSLPLSSQECFLLSMLCVWMGLHVPQPCFHMFEEHARNQTLGQRRSVQKKTAILLLLQALLHMRIGPPRVNPQRKPPLGHYTPAAVPVGWPLVSGCWSTLSPLFEVSSDPGRFTMEGTHNWHSYGGTGFARGRPQNEGVLLPTFAVEFRDAGLKD